MSDRSTLPVALMAGGAATLLGAALIGAGLVASGAVERGDGLLWFRGVPTLPVEVPLHPADNAMLVPMTRLLTPGAGLPGAGAPRRMGELPERELERLLAWTPDSGDDTIVEKLLVQGLLGYAVVEVTPSELRVSGRPVLDLQGGVAPEDARRGMMIIPLYDALLELAEAHKELGSMAAGWDFRGELLLAIHPDVPTGTVRQVLYSAGQSQYGALLLAVDDPSPGEVYTGSRGAFTEGLGHTKLTVVQTAEEVKAYMPVGFERSGPTAEADAVLAEAAQAAAPVCAIYVDDGAPSFGAAADTLDAMFTPTVQWMVWASGQHTTTAAEPINRATAAAAPWTVGLRDQVDVLPVTLHRLSDPGGSVGVETCDNTMPLASAEAPARSAAGLFSGSAAPIGRTGGSPIILGALDRSQVDGVIDAQADAIQGCFQREQAERPDLEGKVVVKFVITKDGRVTKASIKSSSVGSAAVEGCMTDLISGLRFPEPKGGGIVIVSYPFFFEG